MGLYLKENLLKGFNFIFILFIYINKGAIKLILQIFNYVLRVNLELNIIL